MPKLHELLAAQDTRTAAYNAVYTETLNKKFGSPHYFHGHVKSLKMLEQNEENTALEEQAREDKPVITTVHDTLQYLFELFVKSEDLQATKNAANRVASATVMWEGSPLLENVPIDELLGLEARLTKIRELIIAVPTLDASKRWSRSAASNAWVSDEEHSTKTEKKLVPVMLAEATKEHPANVTTVSKDVVVGSFKTIRTSGEVTALQKAEAIKRIDALRVAVKQARMRANEIEVQPFEVGQTIVDLIMEPLAD